jgi:hypothetical protein
MNYQEQKQLNDTINELVRKSNMWDQINELFIKENRLKPYLDEAQDEMRESGNCGLATSYVLTISELLEKATDYDNEVLFYNNRFK